MSISPGPPFCVCARRLWRSDLLRSDVARKCTLGLRLVLARGVWMPIGTVKWYDRRKGFGFILDPSGEDVFAHFTSIEGDGYRCLLEGELVEYDVTKGPKGLSALRVKRLDTDRPIAEIAPESGA